MEEKFTAVVYKSGDSGEYDKTLSLITPSGCRRGLMRGVKRPSARLRFAAQPFAFCEFIAVKKGETYIITGAEQIEDLFCISEDSEKFTAGSLILEAAFSALKESCAPQFVFMLKRLKEVIYGANPYLAAVRFLQYLIHDAGYGYDYPSPPDTLKTPMDLLSALWYLQEGDRAVLDADNTLIIKTLIKIIVNFEGKFETELAAKKLI